MSDLRVTELGCVAVLLATVAGGQPVRPAEPGAADGPASVRFVEVTRQIGVTFVNHTDQPSNDSNHAGVAAVDLTGDGFPELFFQDGYEGENHLYVNNRDGTFTEAGEAWGVRTDELTVAPVFFDADGDGLLDLATASRVSPSVQRVRLLLNRGGWFEDVSASSGFGERFGEGAVTSLRGLTAFDHDGDGDTDLFVTQVGTCADLSRAGLVYENLGGGRFALTNPCEFAETGCHQWQAVATDLDMDGALDVFCAEDAGSVSRLLLNDGRGAFVDVGASVGRLGDATDMGLAIGDYDNDGDLDVYTTDLGLFDIGANRLFRNELIPTGDLAFTQVAREAGVRDSGIGWGATFVDYDNDGWLDLAVASADKPSKLFRSRADGTFEDIGASIGFAPVGRANGLIAVDYDGDGDLDLVVANVNGPAQVYRNEGGDSGGAVVIRLRDRTRHDRWAIGARVSLERGDGAAQLREIRTGTSFNSQESFGAHFGVGSERGPFTAAVTWPGGAVTVSRGVLSGDRLVLTRSIADFSMDGMIDTRDFVAFLGAWAAGEAAADVTGDGIVNGEDFDAYLVAFLSDR